MVFRFFLIWNVHSCLLGLGFLGYLHCSPKISFILSTIWSGFSAHECSMLAWGSMHCPITVRTTHIIIVQEIVFFSDFFLANLFIIDRGMFNYTSVIGD